MSLYNYLSQNKLIGVDDKFVGVEMYHWGGSGQHHTEILALYGEEKKPWYFTIHPEPALRHGKRD
jgi:hypothetical protein